MRSARVPASSRKPSLPPAASPTRARTALALLAAAAALGLAPQPAGVSPIGAIALFGGASFASRSAGLVAALAAYALAGLARGAAGDLGAFHALTPAVLGSWALVAALGGWLRRRRSPARIAAASAAGSLLFFAITNFAVWAQLGTYPPSAAGLAACYAAGLPLLARGALGDLAYAAALFGALAMAERRASARAAAPASA
jgi:hypothetical protein